MSQLSNVSRCVSVQQEKCKHEFEQIWPNQQVGVSNEYEYEYEYEYEHEYEYEPANMSRCVSTQPDARHAHRTPIKRNIWKHKVRFYEDGPPDNGLGTSAEKSCGENWPPQEFSRPLFARISLFLTFSLPLEIALDTKDLQRQR